MRVVIQKPDLDTCLTGLILGVEETDEVVAVRGDAAEADLKDRRVFCIEAGGSGMTQLGNFDHHNTDDYFPPACRQSYDHSNYRKERLDQLVEYVSMVDENRKDHPPAPFPSLSNLFSGMLFVEKGPILQFHAGIKLLRMVLAKGLDPFETMPALVEWETYVAAKLENQKQLAMILARAEFHTSRSGLRIGYSEQDAIGGIGILYKQGCHVVVLYSEKFGQPPMRKFTIAGNGIAVGHLKPFLSELESGWGGTRTILGSPREKATRLSKEHLLSIVKEHMLR